jgi:hypothetical protein
VLQGMQGVVVASLEAEWLMAGESRLWGNTELGSVVGMQNTLHVWWVLEPLPPHLMYDVLPSDLSIISESPQPSWVLFSICLFHADIVSALLTSLNCVASMVSQACIPVGVLLCMLVMLLDWNLGLFHKC